MRIYRHVKKYWFVWTGIILISLNIAGIFLVVTLFAQRANDFTVIRTLKKPVDAVKRSLDIFSLPFTFGNQKLKHYDLIIDPKELQKLLQNLPKRTENAILTDAFKKEIPATLLFHDTKYAVKVRFRGETENHWANAKKSWRINFDNEQPLNGYDELHLIIPDDRDYLAEEMNQYRARKLGLTVPDSEFVTLSINGGGKMLYWQVEGWNNEFLERHAKPSDADVFAPDITRIDIPSEHYSIYPPLDDITSYTKSVTDTSRPLDNYAPLKQWMELEDPSLSDAEFTERFHALVDIPTFSAWQALSALAGSRHGERTNLRLYFNTTSGKFEIFPWNLTLFELPGGTLDTTHEQFVSRALRDPETLHERNKALAQYMRETSNLDAELAYYDALWRQIRGPLFADRQKLDSNIDAFIQIRRARHILETNWRAVQTALDQTRVTAEILLEPVPKDPGVFARLTLTTDAFSAVLWRTLRVEFVPETPGASLELWNDDNADGLINGPDQQIGILPYDSKKNASELKDIGITLLPGRRVLPEPDNRLVAMPRSFAYILKNPTAHTLVPQDVDLRFQNAVTGTKVDPAVRVVNNRMFAFSDRFHDTAADIRKRFPFITVESQHPEALIIPSGSHTIHETLIVPQPYTLTIQPGAELSMDPGVSLYSTGVVTAQGTETNPIRIRAAVPDKPWGVFMIVNTHAENIFEHLHISDGSSDFMNGVFSRGMLSVFHGDAIIRNSIFTDAFGDDGVNVKNGHVLITDSRFEKNYFDAFDGDYITGEITHTLFQYNGNDGVDISGSTNILIAHNRMFNNGDKGISVGEASRPIIFNNLIVENNIGIASKDASYPTILNTTLYRNRSNIEAYMKKPLFGGANGKIANSIIWGSEKNIVIDPASGMAVTYSSVEGGYAGEGNREIEPKFDSEYRIIDNRMEGKGNAEILKKISIELKSVPIGFIEN